MMSSKLVPLMVRVVSLQIVDSERRELDRFHQRALDVDAIDQEVGG